MALSWPLPYLREQHCSNGVLTSTHNAVVQSLNMVNELSILCLTWNLHGKSVPTGALRGLYGALRYDIVAVGTQECQKTASMSSVGTLPLLCGGIPSTDDELWRAAVTISLGNEFCEIAAGRLGAICLTVHVNKQLRGEITDVQTSTVACGLADTLGNKGAVGIGFTVSGTSIAIVNSHLAAHHGSVKARNRQYHRIERVLALAPNLGRNRFDGGILRTKSLALLPVTSYSRGPFFKLRSAMLSGTVQCASALYPPTGRRRNESWRRGSVGESMSKRHASVNASTEASAQMLIQPASSQSAERPTTPGDSEASPRHVTGGAPGEAFEQASQKGASKRRRTRAVSIDGMAAAVPRHRHTVSAATTGYRTWGRILRSSARVAPADALGLGSTGLSAGKCSARGSEGGPSLNMWVAKSTDDDSDDCSDEEDIYGACEDVTTGAAERVQVEAITGGHADGISEPPGTTTLSQRYDAVIWMGDLNYRIDGLDRGSVLAAIAAGDQATLAAGDQLTAQRAAGAAFSGYCEGPLAFPPTYKFDPGTGVYDSSRKARIPAWTDRILFTSECLPQALPDRGSASSSTEASSVLKAGEPEAELADGGAQSGGRILSLLSYRSFDGTPKLQVSDHRPVGASFSLRAQRLATAADALGTSSGAAGRLNTTAPVCAKPQQSAKRSTTTLRPAAPRNVDK